MVVRTRKLLLMMIKMEKSKQMWKMFAEKNQEHLVIDWS